MRKPKEKKKERVLNSRNGETKVIEPGTDEAVRLIRDHKKQSLSNTHQVQRDQEDN